MQIRWILVIKGAILYVTLACEPWKACSREAFSCKKMEHSFVNFTRVDSSLGMLPVRLLDLRSLQCKQGWMHVDKRCDGAGCPSFYGLKKRVDLCIHVKKAHRYCNSTKTDSSGGILPDILLPQRFLKCKQVWMNGLILTDVAFMTKQCLSSCESFLLS